MALRSDVLRRPDAPPGGPLVFRSWAAWRWADFITPSTLQLEPLLQILLEPVRCTRLHAQVQLGLQETLVNAVRHGNGNDPSKCLRIRRIETPRWLIWQVQDEGSGIGRAARRGQLPDHCDALGGRGLFLIHQCFDDVRWSRRGNRVQVAVVRRGARPGRFSADGLDSLDP